MSYCGMCTANNWAAAFATLCTVGRAVAGYSMCQASSATGCGGRSCVTVARVGCIKEAETVAGKAVESYLLYLSR